MQRSRMIKIQLPPALKLSTLYRLYVWIAGTTLVLVGIGGGIIWPTIKRLETTTQVILQTLHDNAVAEDKSRNLIQTKRDRVVLERQLASLRSVFIEDHNPLPYLTDLEALANTRDVKLDFNVHAVTDSAVSAGQAIPVETILTMSGSWDNIIGFLNDLMSQPVYLITRDIEFTIESDATIVVELTGYTYWL